MSYVHVKRRQKQQKSMVRPALGPTIEGTIGLLVCILMTYLFVEGETGTELARGYAIGIGIGIGLSTLFDLSKGSFNLIRADFISLFALYFLTLFEFWFPQPRFDDVQTVAGLLPGLHAVALAMAVFAIARHFVSSKRSRMQLLQFKEIKPHLLVTLTLLAASVGYLHMLVAVKFNVVDLFEHMLGPRFSVPWGRGRLGSWKALLTELSLLIYVVPPLCAILWHRRKELNQSIKLLLGFIFIFTLFQGFTSGTRNVLAAYLAGFLAAYILAHPSPSLKKLGMVGAATAGLFIFAQFHMLEFRQIGLKRYIAKHEVVDDLEVRDTIHIDHNLFAISKLIEVFPEQQDFLGAEIPYWAVIKPVPRAIWKGKPEGLSFSIEEAMGMEGLTISTTYIGEAYMAYGQTGIIVFTVFFAMMSAWWNRLGSGLTNTYSILVYASGFFPFVLSMRSMLWFTTAILPTIALIVFYQFYLKPRIKHARPRER